MRAFDRGRNARIFSWAGDPERWGGTAAVVATSNGTRTFGGQILRAQTQDLVACGWDLVATWTMEGLDPTDAGSLDLEVSIGTGQATSTLLWRLAAIVAGAPTTQNAGALHLGWDPLPPPTGFAGVALSEAPIIAAAINARPSLRVTTGALQHRVTAHVIAHCAPRSWAP